MAQPIEITRPAAPMNGSANSADLMFRVPRAATETARKIHDAFLKSLENAVSNYLSAPAICVSVDEKQTEWSDCQIGACPGHTDVLLEVPAFDSICLLRFSWKLLQQVLDILLAAPMVAGDAPRETITPVEMHLLSRFFKLTAAEFESACAAYVRLDSIIATDIAQETIARYQQDAALGFSDRLTLGEQDAPFEVLISGFLARQMNESNGTAIDGPKPLPPSAVSGATVHLEVNLEPSMLCLGDLIDMKLGQILLTDQPEAALFNGLLNGASVFKGELIAAGDRCGFQLTAIEAAPAVLPLER